MAGIYLHIPFCKQACHYCDFHFSTNTSRMSEMVNALESEITHRKGYLHNEKVETIYFGGGTPSLLHAKEINRLLSTINREFTVSPNAEVTLEANPDDLDLQILTDIAAAGVNRLSIGVQSFDDNVLKFLNRAHNGRSAVQAVRDARAAGFRNISIDLIYAITNQTEYEWKETLREALALSPEHISSYCLTIEERTVFGNWLKKGRIQSTPDEHAAAHFEILIEELKGAGFEQYEVSNFARPGFQSKHNSSYWKNQIYLGVGPSAHSFNGMTRQFNVANNHEYLKKLASGEPHYEVEQLSREDQINEHLLTGLRTIWGCNLAYLKNTFGYDLMAHQEQRILALITNGLAEQHGDVVRLTQKGFFVADKISSDLFLLAGE